MLELIADNPLIVGGIADMIRAFVGPLALLACGIAALTFLFQRQFMQMILFLVIAVLVFAVFYAPNMIRDFSENFGEKAGEELGKETWSDPNASKKK